ncbi:transglycosylase domain-containing protein [Consotaella salsifontis]|uniref:peptidoglycan glycosyltransferase n=1 Tax=Consotaella salsifontis TaxID=1365950 RepID=A0A1T4QN72_9HYPH|nr:transglycosylase domain-containing protein [Consotaella salsifontis]SKA05067.1 penicillin-binding protein 2A [Consotaella salsifontis]
MRERASRRLGAALVAFAVLLMASGLALAYAWVNWTVGRYGVTEATTLERAHANKLVIHLPDHGAEPWNAPMEEMMYVAYGDVPPVMREAILTSEDAWFFYHPGFNPIALGKALISQFGGDGRGGSTITQQLAKQLYVGSRHAMTRKFDELAIALWLEWHFDKKTLLELYFNTPFMGHGTKGIEAAARHYFGYSFKKAGRWQPVAFTPEMAASLAVTIKNPTGGNPTEPLNMARARRLLLAMGIEPKVLSEKAVRDPGLPRRFAAAAFEESGRLSDQFSSARNLAAFEVSARLGAEPRTLDVVTYYSSEIQLYLEKAIATYYPRIEAAGYDRLTAVVVDNANGGIRAIVAPPNARIYPGSTVKPFAALCAIVDHGWTEGTKMLDTPVGVPPVRNFDRHYLGSIALETALMRSRNPPFVRLVGSFGADCPNGILARMNSPLRLSGPTARSLALGAEPVSLKDLLGAYVTIATCGRVANAPMMVEEARDALTQKVVMRQTAKGLPAADARLTNGFDMLHAMLAKVTGPGGTANGSRFVREVAAKTGTSDNNRQITLITFTGAYTVLVSAGASDPAKLKRRYSSSALVPLVKNLNSNIHPEDYRGALGCPVSTEVAHAERDEN